MKRESLSVEVAQALGEAARAPGWNNRSRDVKRFHLAHPHGLAPCTLYVVPFRRWAFRRIEQHAAALRDERVQA